MQFLYKIDAIPAEINAIVQYEWLEAVQIVDIVRHTLGA